MEKKKLTRLPDSILICRNWRKEASLGIKNISYYVYKPRESWLRIVGQVFAGDKITKEFCLKMVIYDRDGDVMISEVCEAYGDGLVSSMIRPKSYFNGFPYVFNCYDVRWKEISRIDIIPANDY